MNKRLLFITHQLSRTGAPIVLLDMIRICHHAGAEISVITLLDGELRSDLEQMGIPVTVQDNFVKRWNEFQIYCRDFDIVIANTLLTYQVIHVLNNTMTPVLWWLHEGEQYFEYFKTVLPDFQKLGQNIFVYPVSAYVQQVLQRRYGFNSSILPFGIQEETGNTTVSSYYNRIDKDHKKTRFLTAGTYSNVKGQDFLAAAIRALPEDVRRTCSFLFCGNEEMCDADVFRAVEDLCLDFPDEVFKLPAQQRNTVLKLMQDCDYLLIPSRVEPLPTVAIEAMMMSTPSILSDICGVSYYLTHGENAFLFRSEDVPALMTAINDAVKLREYESYDFVCTNARQVYDEVFSYKKFTQTVLTLLG